jgi:hypothetical protein
LRTKRLLSATVGIIFIVVMGLPLLVWLGFPTLAPLLARGYEVHAVASSRRVWISIDRG